MKRYYSPENQKEHGYEVAQNHAIRIAQNHFDLRAEYFGKQKILKQVKNLEIIRDSISQKPLLYVIQYKSGFCIMSADSREQPILAYSEDNDWIGSSLRGPDIF
ncbi:Spi family protease inhibitor [Marinoscillum sp.]|uniref:Spi family protease inhibitor n=1 Tax=Marinoscillum sp. TaxID=2024838 RepID=UPI003BA9DE59